MRNKGFFWFLTILLAVICIYQLSFTWVSASEEKKAEIEAGSRVDALRIDAEANNMIGYLPNNTTVDFNNPEAGELAKAAFINQILKEKAETPVHPLFGSTFKVVKQRSLAFGLDLVGGMSVTLEISIPELVKNYAQNPRDITFRKTFDAAKEQYGLEGGDFISVFHAEYVKQNPKTPFVRLFAIADIDELKTTSTDEEVLDFLKSKESNSMDGVEEIMNRRINQFGVAQPNIQKDPANNRLYIELPGVQDEATVSEKLQSTANLQFYETYDINTIGAEWQNADLISRAPQLEIEEVDEEDSIAIVENVIEEDSLSEEDKTAALLEDDNLLDLEAEEGVNGLSQLISVTGGFAIGLPIRESPCAPPGWTCRARKPALAGWAG